MVIYIPLFLKANYEQGGQTPSLPKNHFNDNGCGNNNCIEIKTCFVLNGLARGLMDLFISSTIILLWKHSNEDY